jgi:hypothetical protein
MALAERVIDAMRAARVGGAFWLPPVALPPWRDIALAPTDQLEADVLIAEAVEEGVAARCLMLGPFQVPRDAPIARLERPADPWQIAADMRELRVGGGMTWRWWAR